MRIKVLICSVLEILLAFDNSTDIKTAVMPAVTSWDMTNAATTTTSATTTTQPTTTEPTTTSIFTTTDPVTTTTTVGTTLDLTTTTLEPEPTTVKDTTTTVTTTTTDAVADCEVPLFTVHCMTNFVFKIDGKYLLLVT